MPRIALVLVALLASGTLNSATYKWVDGGQVHYGDRPPSADAKPMSLASPAPAASANVGDSRLPYALRTAASRYPVTLYTGRDCEPCERARDHLARRGIPFSERELRTDRDIEALKRLGFNEPSVPSVRVGRESAAGYQADAWDRLFDAAGYPRRSMLPSGWRPAPAQPLAAAPQPQLAKPQMTAEWLNDPANQRDDMRDTLVAPEARTTPIIQAPTGRPAVGSNIRF